MPHRPGDAAGGLQLARVVRDCLPAALGVNHCLHLAIERVDAEPPRGATGRNTANIKTRYAAGSSTSSPDLSPLPAFLGAALPLACCGHPLR